MCAHPTVGFLRSFGFISCRSGKDTIESVCKGEGKLSEQTFYHIQAGQSDFLLLVCPVCYSSRLPIGGSGDFSHRAAMCHGVSLKSCQRQSFFSFCPLLLLLRASSSGCFSGCATTKKKQIVYGIRIKNWNQLNKAFDWMLAR